MVDQDNRNDLEFWIIPLRKDKEEVYAKVSDFGEAGEKLIEADTNNPQIDYVLKPVKR